MARTFDNIRCFIIISILSWSYFYFDGVYGLRINNHGFDIATGTAVPFITPKDIVSSYCQDGQETISSKLPPLSRTVLFVPNEYISKNVTFVQKFCSNNNEYNNIICGRFNLQQYCQQWENEFQSELGVQSFIRRISTIDDITTVIVQWNVTWIPPTVMWLETLGNNWPGGLQIIPTSYHHLSNQIITKFSWKAVGKLFTDAITTGKLRIPLACIEGISTLKFKINDNNNSDSNNTLEKYYYYYYYLDSISEDLSFALDMQHGALKNRKCSADLRVFLETGRRINYNNKNNNIKDWDDIVATALPWESVPGNNPLDIDEQEDGPLAATIFIGFAALCIFIFANIMAPELIGQSLFGPPNYIVSPNELDKLF